MKSILFPLLAILAIGCAGAVSNPVSPDDSPRNNFQMREMQNQAMIGPHMLWGEFNIFFNDDHSKVDVVPNRQGRFHLNTLKFLEEYCTDCLEVTGIHNNGDSTIDLTVRITHPFPDNPEYTGFDVKGIIMFNGSHDVPWGAEYLWPYGTMANPVNIRVSWREAGDPEVLNPDGYSILWSPDWDSGSDLPIYNYWQGKYSSGTPTASINAFLNFYTDDERHMFQVGNFVERTYHIYVPPGPVAAGYAIDACWEPPIVTPVTDPVIDFPFSANQPEPYHFRFIFNNGEPMTEDGCCGWAIDCSDWRVEQKDWYDELQVDMVFALPPIPPNTAQMQFPSNLPVCDSSPPDMIWQTPDYLNISAAYPDGNYRGVACLYGKSPTLPWTYHSMIYTVFDFTIDME